jgi:arsenite methyltransferase
MRMVDLDPTLAPALRRALELFADPPTKLDTSKGYLDLLGTTSVDGGALPKGTGAIQAMWASPVVAMFYDNTQAVLRKLLTALQPPVEWLNIPQLGHMSRRYARRHATATEPVHKS